MSGYINVGVELGKLREEIEKMKKDIGDNLTMIVKNNTENSSFARLKSKELEDRIKKLEGKSGGRRTRGKKRGRSKRKSRRRKRTRKRRKKRRKSRRRRR